MEPSRSVRVDEETSLFAAGWTNGGIAERAVMRLP